MSKTSSSIELGFIRLNRRKRDSLATQLYQALSRAILDGQLAKGFRLPSTRSLADDLGVSRTTVVSAFDQLTAEGYLQGNVGKGTFVSDNLPEEHQMVHFQSPRDQESKFKSTVEPEPADLQKVNLTSYGNEVAKSESAFPTGLENLIPFVPGVPALDEFPVEVWSKIVRRNWKELSTKNLSYGVPHGYAPLRAAIAEYLRAFRGVKCHEDQVFIVAGTQQAVDLVTRLFVDTGDEVVFENPGYTRALTTFQAAGAKIVPVDVDDCGLDVKQAIAKAPNARLAYVTPSHQFPMGVTLSIERRMKLIQWAKETGGLIFEDDYDSEYRYSHRPIPALQGLGASEQTLYVGSFSKVIYPSLSMGYLVVPERFTTLFGKAIKLNGRPASTLDQMVLAEFIAEGHFARHLRRMRQIHQQRRIALVESIEQHLEKHLKVIGCDAGLHCATLLLKHKDDRAVSQLLQKNGIVSRPLSSYCIGGESSRSGLVLGFASARPGRLKNAVRRVRQILES